MLRRNERGGDRLSDVLQLTNELFEPLLKCLKLRGECGLTLWTQRAKRIGEKLSPFGLISDTVAFDQCQALRVAERMLRHRVQNFVLIILGDGGEAKSA